MPAHQPPLRQADPPDLGQLAAPAGHDARADRRQLAGGEGPPLLLVHGWPETWYYWRLVMPALARDFSIVAPDQRGIGLSDKPAEGYDTGTAAADLVALMEALGHQRFAMVGVDTGMPIAYALAADHRDRLDRHGGICKSLSDIYYRR